MAAGVLKKPLTACTLSPEVQSCLEALGLEPARSDIPGGNPA
jgi:hypothetical protein